MTILQYIWGKIRSLKRILKEIDLEVVSVKRGHETFYSLKKSSTAAANDKKDTKSLETEIKALKLQVKGLLEARVVDAKHLRAARAETTDLKGRLDKVLQVLEEDTVKANPAPARAESAKSCVDILISNMSAFKDDDEDNKIFDAVKFLAEAADSNHKRKYSTKGIKRGLNDDDLDEQSIKDILANEKLGRLNARLSKFGLKIVEYEKPTRYALERIKK